jgi:hypothetical protein
VSFFLKKFLKPRFVREWTQLLRQKGVKGFVREKGLKVLLIVFLFYLIRDGLLYIVIPFLVAQGFIC